MDLKKFYYVETDLFKGFGFNLLEKSEFFDMVYNEIKKMLDEIKENENYLVDNFESGLIELIRKVKEEKNLADDVCLMLLIRSALKYATVISSNNLDLKNKTEVSVLVDTVIAIFLNMFAVCLFDLFNLGFKKEGESYDS